MKKEKKQKERKCHKCDELLDEIDDGFILCLDCRIDYQAEVESNMMLGIGFLLG